MRHLRLPYTGLDWSEEVRNLHINLCLKRFERWTYTRGRTIALPDIADSMLSLFHNELTKFADLK